MIVERILAHRWPADPQADPATFSSPVDCADSDAAAAPLVGALLVETAGVVYDDTCWWRWLARVLSHAGIHARYETLLENWEAEFLQRPERDGNDFWPALRRCLRRMGLTTGCCDEVQASACALHKQWESSLHPFPEIAQTLAELSLRNVPMIAVAGVGCSCEGLSGRLRSLALAGHFPRLLSAQRGGRWLADPDFYATAASEFSVGANEVALVSNKAWHLSAARQAGLATVAVNCPRQARADVQLDRPAALLWKLRYRSHRSMAA
jgi:FMN phosphatase YigB (HAD superfamily)